MSTNISIKTGKNPLFEAVRRQRNIFGKELPSVDEIQKSIKQQDSAKAETPKTHVQKKPKRPRQKIDDELVNACKNSDIAAVERLLNAGADADTTVDYHNRKDSPILCFASDKGQYKIVELLLANGADINAKDQNGMAPLGLACFEHHAEVAELLVKNGADVNDRDNYGRSALGFAKQKNLVNLVGLLIQYGATESKEDLQDYFCVICGKGNIIAVKNIIGLVDIKDDALGGPALSFAKSPDIIRFLVEKGANLNAVNDFGDTPLIAACGRSGNLKKAELLIELGADVNAKGRYGMTALMHAKSEGKTDISAMLLEKGADPTLVDDKGRSASMHEQMYLDYLKRGEDWVG